MTRANSKPKPSEYSVVVLGLISLRYADQGTDRLREFTVEDLTPFTLLYVHGPIKNPARFSWHEVKKVDHCYLSVDALTQPMQARDPTEPYGNPRG